MKKKPLQRCCPPIPVPGLLKHKSPGPHELGNPGFFDCPDPTDITITVGPAGPPTFDFSTIQAAINAANYGDIISVAPGTYLEQITIPAGKDNLIIVSSRQLGAIIKPPSGGLTGNLSILTINAKCTRIARFKIAGPSTTKGNLQNGILVTKDGSAIIVNTVVTDIRDNPLSDLQQGTGINVDGGAATIDSNTISNYQLTGIRVNGQNVSRSTIFNSVVTGVGPTNVIIQNGIQISRGARAFIQSNNISRNNYTGQGFVSTGILLFQQDAGVNVLDNKSFNNNAGIYLATTRRAIVQKSLFINNQFGIFVTSDSENNIFSLDQAVKNTTFDVEDDSIGNKNSYPLIRCQTDNKNGAICHSHLKGKKPKSKTVLDSFFSGDHSKDLSISVD
ncbi:right-handed parallel beta-helix repeat-containing protein [Bacillus sp. EAC]|uniref:right-handed parallel beta-helix repeat-containing protein n=1 Tax=Bacillus sp. EAC TaxID=1978338 RepID=UPI0015C51E0D|nr:right-handed parallel beta-helix repeat-containing protein [Bacillus sp. EAC]